LWPILRGPGEDPGEDPTDGWNVSVHGVGFARPVDELLIPGSNRSVAT
jgi:hypothetical protein